MNLIFSIFIIVKVNEFVYNNIKLKKGIKKDMQLIGLLITVPCAFIAIVLHELAHGYVSYLLGDPTPKDEGRLTLDPMKHFDLVGLLCLIFFRFGWAKPVRVNPLYYRKPKQGMALVALAGPLTNFIIAFLSLIIVVITSKFNNIICLILYTFFLYLARINVSLGIFNLIPVPPLDGSKILGIFLPNESYYKYMSYQKYGMIIIFGIIIVSNIIGSALGTGSLLILVVEKIVTGLMNLIDIII